MSDLLLDGGKKIGEVAWPAYDRKAGGTCDFMTPLCAEHCKLKTNSFEIDSFEFFEDNLVHIITRKLIREVFENDYSCVSWWIGSGDCPKRHTTKVLEVMETIAGLKIPQNGFTRNRELWMEANTYSDMRIALTVEKEDFKDFGEWANSKGCRYFDEGHPLKGFLISEPNYDQCVVKIYKLGYNSEHHYGGCGSGYVEYQIKQDGSAPKTFVEDCSTCLKNGVGCYGMVKSKLTRVRVKK